MNRAPLDYDARQPDDPGVDEANPAARPFDWRLIISLFLLHLAAIGAFVWVLA